MNGYNNSKRELLPPKRKKLLGTIFLVLGIGFLILSFFNITSYLRRNSQYVEIEGTIQRYLTNNNGWKAIVVEYEVDGQFYYKISKEYVRIPARVGSVVSVKYNPSNPNDAVWGGDHWNYSFLLFSFVFLGLSGLLFFNDIKEFIEKLKKKWESRPKKEKPVKEKKEKPKKEKEEKGKKKKGKGKEEEKEEEKKEEDVPYDGPPLVVFTDPDPNVNDTK